MLPIGVNDVSKIRKTLKLFYLKEAGWNLSRFHICFYWPEVFWLGKIFLILSAFPQCPTKTCVRMGNIFGVPKESSLCLKDMAELRVERGPSGRGGRCLRINFKHSMHTFFIHTNICCMRDKMWFWRALHDFPFTCIVRDAKAKQKKRSLLREQLRGAWHIYSFKSWP